MGLLDQYAAFAQMNPNARNIANDIASYMDTVSNKQKQQYQDMFKNSAYTPAANVENKNSDNAVSPWLADGTQLYGKPTIFHAALNNSLINATGRPLGGNK